MLPKEKWEELIITTAMLMGGEPTYYDYGHPERANARLYWSIRNNPPDAYGYSRARCAYNWLRKRGVFVHRDGEIKQGNPAR